MITKCDDVIDSRDIIERIAQLQAIRVAGPVPEGILEDEDYETDQDILFHELAVLEALEAQASDYTDWEDGAQLIRDSYFERYAQELADDCDLVPADASWPMTCIDWAQAARELQQDYTSVEFDGVTYWVR